MHLVAVFVSAAYLEIGRIRVWARQVPRDWFVLTTDVTHEPNSELLRQLRCACVPHAIARVPRVTRTLEEFQTAQAERDRAMFSVAERVVVFGHPTFAGVEVSEDKITRY